MRKRPSPNFDFLYGQKISRRRTCGRFFKYWLNSAQGCGFKSYWPRTAAI
ncbi:hypothetical protein SUBVAR_05125 [Subdoligranulum variabile DSM 15176]|uniref:Uncharacterized protein n=1 Tax=Subdoligranulum variabile DSM 15176 TaxID=411471 RepID=D1PL87_9FIRM|nr:hypothetical protein SUBVAR_05125 [Subdoligranulum variabile DSM 15176]